MKSSKIDHKPLALWAATCAEHVLACFESARPGDARPRNAIAAARAWTRGELAMTAARKAAFDAHAAARDAGEDPAACAAARAAGHAAATAHVATHAPYAAQVNKNNEKKKDIHERVKHMCSHSFLLFGSLLFMPYKTITYFCSMRAKQRKEKKKKKR